MRAVSTEPQLLRARVRSNNRYTGHLLVPVPTQVRDQICQRWAAVKTTSLAAQVLGRHPLRCRPEGDDRGADTTVWAVRKANAVPST